MTQVPILIAGGGIAGLAAALACAQTGREVVVLERAPAFQEVGAGLQLGPNAVRALKALGAWDDVAKIASTPSAIVMRDAHDGKLLRRIGLGASFSERFGEPYRVAHRADLHGALLACAIRKAGVRVLAGYEISKVNENDHDISVGTANGGAFVGEILIAGDGVNSNLRQKLWPGSAAISTGQTLHRALLDVPPGLNNCEAVNLWMGPGYHVVHYVVGPRRRLNVVCVTQAGQSPRTLANTACAELSTLLDLVPQWLPWDALHVPALPHWNRGRIMLIGDAAHGTVPFFAQGAAMAMEDAALLKVLLASGEALPDALDGMNRRRARVMAVHEASLRQGAIYGARGVMAAARNTMLRLMPERLFLRQLSWLYGFQT